MGPPKPPRDMSRTNLNVQQDQKETPVSSVRMRPNRHHKDPHSGRRRHTLQGGFDASAVRRQRLWEEKRAVLDQGVLLVRRVHDWYGYAFLAPYGLLLGTLLHGARISWQEGKGPLAGLLLLPAAVLLASHLLASPTLRPYRNLEQAGQLAQQTLARFERLIDKAQPGQVLEMNPWTPVLPPHSDGSEVRNLFLYAQYSMQAYAELLRPDATFEVTTYQGRKPAPRADCVQVQLVPALPPSWFDLR